MPRALETRTVTVRMLAVMNVASEVTTALQENASPVSALTLFPAILGGGGSTWYTLFVHALNY